MNSATLTIWGIYSVWRRHAKVYQRNWLVNFLPHLLEPLLYLVAFGYGLKPLVHEVTYLGHKISYLEFIAPAMIGAGVLFQSFLEGSYGTFLRLHYQKTWQALLTTRLNFAEVFVGDWLWAATKGMIVGCLTGLVATLLGIYSAWNLLLSLPLMLLGSLLFGGIGVLTASCIRQIEQVNLAMFLLIVPMFTFCGTYFPRRNLPPVMEAIANVLPLASLIDLLRWNFGLPPFWWVGLIWLFVLVIAIASLAARFIYAQVIR
jgi:lipooligosaccharide transport system permease protein